jgi:hypothetical protein
MKHTPPSTPHVPSDPTIEPDNLLRILAHHGHTARVQDGAVQVWEEAALITHRSGRSRVEDLSAWVLAPTTVNTLGAWLGY